MTGNGKKYKIPQNKRYTFWAICTCFVLFITSCKTEELIPPEPDKNIVGTWEIVTAIRNDIVLFDTTKLYDNPGHFDFASFEINFNADNTFTTNDNAPFISGSKGTWSLDQPFSKKITFVDDNGSQASLDFYYPITSGERQLIIAFSADCEKNVYKYILERIK